MRPKTFTNTQYNIPRGQKVNNNRQEESNILRNILRDITALLFRQIMTHISQMRPRPALQARGLPPRLSHDLHPRGPDPPSDPFPDHGAAAGWDSAKDGKRSAGTAKRKEGGTRDKEEKAGV